MLSLDKQRAKIVHVVHAFKLEIQWLMQQMQENESTISNRDRTFLNAISKPIEMLWEIDCTTGSELKCKST